ncbi:hypothetical protein EQG79_25550 [Spirosoma sordidisoli]|uniref:Uncharacterized protein n=1 Tax=Spirosoma sordidisoli TaxID=2502893 RepID=A0A4Q2UJ71_9BACT|nr:hypothetical protein EQG79_25550 [Spirosoma sordidisoli]
MAYRLDRSAFHAGTFEQTEQYHMACQPTAYADRLRVAAYLNSVAYRYDPDKPPRLDRTAFSARKHTS